jgi:hypothetical protein
MRHSLRQASHVYSVKGPAVIKRAIGEASGCPHLACLNQVAGGQAPTSRAFNESVVAVGTVLPA